jgi:signal transduction histidine kinase
VASASVRLRTTLAAVLVVAVALAVGGFALVALLRDNLHDGVVSSAEERASSLAAQIKSAGLPDSLAPADDEEADEPGDVVIQVADESGAVVLASQDLGRPLPTSDRDEMDLPGAEYPYVVVTDDADVGEQEYVVSVAATLEDVEESTGALVPLLLAGLPVLLVVVGGTTWLVVSRALAPVERIRREVDEISDDRLDRRVRLPGARDEVHRLAATMNAMLERLERGRERQQRFVSDASHELRSPLAGLRQTAEVAHAHPGALPEGELVAAVLEESLRMQRIVEQLLVLTRTDERGVRERREVDLDDLALAEAARVRREGLTVDVSGVGAGRVLGDRGALSQVVRNLVDNAARHASGRVAVAVTTVDGTVRLAVDDDGHGVPPEEQQRVFERFVRLDEARARDDGGSGLGLAIVREITRVHGGEATAEDSTLGGARFVVRLPTA